MPLCTLQAIRFLLGKTHTPLNFKVFYNASCTLNGKVNHSRNTTLMKHSKTQRRTLNQHFSASSYLLQQSCSCNLSLGQPILYKALVSQKSNLQAAEDGYFLYTDIWEFKTSAKYIQKANLMQILFKKKTKILFLKVPIYLKNFMGIHHCKVWNTF